jgi:hypothetical protein
MQSSNEEVRATIFHSVQRDEIPAPFLSTMLWMQQLTLILRIHQSIPRTMTKSEWHKILGQQGSVKGKSEKAPRKRKPGRRERVRGEKKWEKVGRSYSLCYFYLLVHFLFCFSTKQGNQDTLVMLNRHHINWCRNMSFRDDQPRPSTVWALLPPTYQ